MRRTTNISDQFSVASGAIRNGQSSERIVRKEARRNVIALFPWQMSDTRDKEGGSNAFGGGYHPNPVRRSSICTDSDRMDGQLEVGRSAVQSTVNRRNELGGRSVLVWSEWSAYGANAVRASAAVREKNTITVQIMTSPIQPWVGYISHGLGT